MNRKINTICFIFLFLFLIGAASATDCENETIISTQQPDPNQDLCKSSVEKNEQLGATATNVKEKVTLTAPNLNMYYKDGSKFKATLKDSNKNAIPNAKIIMTVNGKRYEKTTDSKGVASLDINLRSGRYTVLANFTETSKYNAQSVKSTINVKSTIRCGDLTKYYKNPIPYTATFYNKNGNAVKNAYFQFTINAKTYNVKSDSNGVGSLPINLYPGKYSISLLNSKTSERVTKTVTVKSLIETKDLTVNERIGGEFNIKILDSNGKPSPNQKVSLKINGKTYTRTTNKNGIATLDIGLNAGNYTMTTKYNGLKSNNKIIVKKAVKSHEFIHTTLIPDHVNVTVDYVYKNSKYSLKTGANGIIKMPKNELFTVQIGENTYKFSTKELEDNDSTIIGSKNYLIALDGRGVKSDNNKAKLRGDGIVISRVRGYTQIDYKSRTLENVELFGYYASKGPDSSETLTYMENNKVTAKITFKTTSYDEVGIKYSLSKFYGKCLHDFDCKSYDEITNHNTASIKFSDNGKPITFNYLGNSVAGYPSKEGIITKFRISNKEELVKTETISYGLSEKYRNSLGFEVLQAYTIINEKITQNIVESWVKKNPDYLNRFGVMNVYGMHLASLETIWLADAFADKYSREFDVNWKRDSTLTILGGINLDDTYLHVLNADMGMTVKGNEKNVVLFRLVNSLYLPNLEDYSLSEVANRYLDNTTNSLDNVLSSISKNEFSFAQLGEMIYIFSPSEARSTIALNTTSGIANVILNNGNSTYKGSSIATSRDCCGVGIMPKDIIRGIRKTIDFVSNGREYLCNILDELHPLSVMAYLGVKLILDKTLQGAPTVYLGLFSVMTVIQTGGTIYRDKIVDESEWHKTMDTITFTRPGYLQGKKVYNIPNKNGGHDYVEVKINDDLTLDRNNALYISNGKTKQLTKAETYKYFSEDYWTPFSMPAKYWDKSWKGD